MNGHEWRGEAGEGGVRHSPIYVTSFPAAFLFSVWSSSGGRGGRGV